MLTEPVFDRWTNGLRSVNRWLALNGEALEKKVVVWGDRLLSMWDALIQKAGTYAALVGAAGVASQMSLGGKLAGVGGKLKWPMMAMVAGAPAGTAGMQIFGVLRGALNAVGGPLMYVTGAFLAVRAAISEYPKMVLFVATSTATLLESLGRLGTAFDSLTTEGSALNMAGAAILGVFGGLIRVVDIGVRIVSSLVTGLGLVFNVMGIGFKAIKAVMFGDYKQADIYGDYMAKAFVDSQERLKSIWGLSGEDKKTLEEILAARGGPKGPGDQRTNVNLNGPITIVPKLEVNEDPTRVAYMIGDVIEQLGRFKQQARRVPTPSF
jgi:hypothetical protein